MRCGVTLVLIIIILVLFIPACYCMGVERGKASLFEGAGTATSALNTEGAVVPMSTTSANINGVVVNSNVVTEGPAAGTAVTTTTTGGVTTPVSVSKNGEVAPLVVVNDTAMTPNGDPVARHCTTCNKWKLCAWSMGVGKWADTTRYLCN
jgi:hypothetical protein